MNPAALKANLADLPRGATLIVDTDEFTARNLAKVGYAEQPARRRHPGLLPRARARPDLDDGRGAGVVRPEPQGRGAGEEHVRPRPAVLAVPPPDRGHRAFLKTKFATKPEILAANLAALHAGLELRRDDRGLRGLLRGRAGADCRRARYRNITGNLALAYGLVAAAHRAGLPLFLGAYPITPASDILHELASTSASASRTFQAEDEIAGIGAALGAAFGGALGVTTTSGPGIALKAETIGLAVSLELPLVICRHPARRALDRAADQDRAGRPAAGDVRPQRRGAGADRRAAARRSTASTPRSRRSGSRRPTARR